MAMLYTLKRQKSSILPSGGKFVARAVHAQTVTNESIENEIEANTSARISDVKLVMTELAYVVARHLRNGDRVTLKGIGTLKLEITGRPVDSRSLFRKERDIAGVRLHVIPESRNGKPALYQDIEFKPMR